MYNGNWQYYKLSNYKSKQLKQNKETCKKFCVKSFPLQLKRLNFPLSFMELITEAFYEVPVCRFSLFAPASVPFCDEAFKLREGGGDLRAVHWLRKEVCCFVVRII